LDGVSGTSGISGSTGSSGTSGINGSSGTSGSSGTRGTSGSSGSSGTSGSSGSSGSSGTSGIDGLTCIDYTLLDIGGVGGSYQFTDCITLTAFSTILTPGQTSTFCAILGSQLSTPYTFATASLGGNIKIFFLVLYR
jgi:hypothetical protein